MKEEPGFFRRYWLHCFAVFSLQAVAANYWGISGVLLVTFAIMIGGAAGYRAGVADYQRGVVSERLIWTTKERTND